jgi:hypothetical protein
MRKHLAELRQHRRIRKMEEESTTEKDQESPVTKECFHNGNSRSDFLPIQPACVFSDSRSCRLLLSPLSANMLKFVRCYQPPVTALSTHDSPLLPDHQNHSNCIQLP